MNRRIREKGEGKLGLLVAIVVVGLAIFVGVKVLPVRIAAYEFRDVLREEARYAAVRHNDAEVVKRIMRQAEELEIPLLRKNLEVKRTIGEMVVTAHYEQAIDLKFTVYVFRFNAKEKAPLF